LPGCGAPLRFRCRHDDVIAIPSGNGDDARTTERKVEPCSPVREGQLLARTLACCIWNSDLPALRPAPPLVEVSYRSGSR
jgi:hypothetical protein